MAKSKSNTPAPAKESKRTRISQSDIPSVALPQATRIATALWDNFAGAGAAPHQIAIAVGMSPTSGPWRSLCGASIAYGLTEGGYNASEITLSPLGRRLVAPTEEGDDLSARVEAILLPRVQKEFFEKYNRAKFPRDDIAANVLIGIGVPKERAKDVLALLKANGEHAGIIQETTSGPFVALDTPSPAAVTRTTNENNSEPFELDKPDLDSRETTRSAQDLPQKKENNRVFITHGKNHKILDQVKKIVSYGKFEAVVAKDRETGAKPVPDKVMDDMRGCRAAVIHVGLEGMLYDAEGQEHPQINPNVLIEIGAAMALYKRDFILLVQDGITLPSNLQGLYECRYSGDGLDMEATMKLLEAFNTFK